MAKKFKNLDIEVFRIFNNFCKFLKSKIMYDLYMKFNSNFYIFKKIDFIIINKLFSYINYGIILTLAKNLKMRFYIFSVLPNTFKIQPLKRNPILFAVLNKIKE